MSDLARNAVQRLIADGNRQREDEELSNKVHRLERLIEQVTEQLQILHNQNHQPQATNGMTSHGASTCASTSPIGSGEGD
jgi:hypothetical protein